MWPVNMMHQEKGRTKYEAEFDLENDGMLMSVIKLEKRKEKQ